MTENNPRQVRVRAVLMEGDERNYITIGKKVYRIEIEGDQDFFGSPAYTNSGIKRKLQDLISTFAFHRGVYPQEYTMTHKATLSQEKFNGAH